MFSFKSITILFLCFASVGINASAQSLSVGAKVGAPLNDSFAGTIFSSTDLISKTRPYTIGPSVEWMFSPYLGVQADALYKRTGYTVGLFGFNTSTKFNNWEFPLLLKTRFSGESVGAFADGGLALRYVDGLTSYSALATSLNQPLQLTHPWGHGVAVGGGVSMKWAMLHFEPELRYTRWIPGDSSIPSFLSNRNQIEYLLGVRFGK